MKGSGRMKVLALWGKKDSGKSSTILRLVGLMMADGAAILRCGQPWKSTTDWWFVLNYRGRTYGITSRGDADDMLAEDFADMGVCNRYVCSTRTKEGTVDFLKERFLPDEIYWLRQVTLNEGTYDPAVKAALHSRYHDINRRQAELMWNILR